MVKHNRVSKFILFVSFAFTLWSGMWIQDWLTHRELEYRPVAARGDYSQDENNTITIFQRASPSVVYITTLSSVMNPWSRSVSQVSAGTGSGFFWDSKGHIVTNYHVIREATGAQVRLTDGRVFNASLIGISPEHDLAILRVKPGFDIPPPIPLGVSSELVVGQKVYAIGNPFGLDYTLTSGIVSALNRSLSEDKEFVIRDLIQTDAAINPGNSGGPLLDSAGLLIGVNTAIYSPSGASAGIGFAVPVDVIARIVPRLIQNGKYRLPDIGVIDDSRVNTLIKQQYGIDGVVILGIKPESKAEALGLIPAGFSRYQELLLGDVIVEINGVLVSSLRDIGYVLENQPNLAEITVIRKGERKTITDNTQKKIR